MKAKELIFELDSSQKVNAKQVELSRRYGGAWVYNVLPFTHTVIFSQYKSPSSVPDHHFEICHNQIGYKGKIVSFSDAAQWREQQRGYSADR